MKIKPKFSNKFYAVQKRLKALPKYLEKSVDSLTYNEGEEFIKEYQEGLKKDNFGLKRLHPVSKAMKRLKGYSQPNTPLYGAGETEKNSYINALRLRRIKNGYRVFISPAKHHDSELPLKALFDIHENGCLIKVTEKMRAFLPLIGIHLRNETEFIRIPPRPTRKKAFIRYLEKRLKNDSTVKKTQKAIKDYIKTGRWQLFLKDNKK